MPDDFLFNHSATHGGDDVLHDYFNDNLEVPIHDLTDAQVCKFNFFKRLAHYSNGSRISNRNCKAVKLVILAEAGTYVRGLDPMKRAKQEDIFSVSTCILSMILRTNYSKTSGTRRNAPQLQRGQKGEGGSLLPPCIESRRRRLIIYAKLLPSFLK